MQLQRAVLASFLSLMILPAVAGAATVFFSDDFDTDTSASYTTNADPDTLATFLYDYSADGIPSAPNSTGGSTLGVKFQANYGDATATAAAINISPTGQSFTGDYILRFDMWINANGPFPDGGFGSTEFITAGVGTVGASVQKSSGTSDGAWFAVDGEGQSGIDFRSYVGTSLATGTDPAYGVYHAGIVADARSADNTYYHGTFPGGQMAPLSQQTAHPQQTGALKAGAVGFAWRDVEITKLGDDVSWTIDGLPIATRLAPTLAGSNIFVGYWDVFASISDNAALSFGIVDNVRVVEVPEPASLSLLALGVLALGRRRRRA